jgi:hypothetical protein
MDLEEVLLAVWRQVLVDGVEAVELAGRRFPVHLTPRKNLRQVDFTFRGKPFRGLEQNPRTGSHWAELARSGARVMQFLSSGRYIAVVVNGEVTLYKGISRLRQGAGG